MRKLEGRVALVTGSGRNIGRATALAMAELGAGVAVHGHTNRAAVDAVVSEVQAHGVKAVAVMGDVADPAQVRNCVAQARDALGPIDILVSNVAVRPHASFLEITPEQWREVMSTNLDACFYLCRAVIPDMLARRNGSIIAISGTSAFGSAERAHVSTSKAGLIGLMKALAKEFAPANIRANCVVPGSVDTVRHNPQWYPLASQTRERRVEGIPMGRMATPDEIGATCAFLATDDAAYITGQALVMAGGQIM